MRNTIPLSLLLILSACPDPTKDTPKPGGDGVAEAASDGGKADAGEAGSKTPEVKEADAVSYFFDAAQNVYPYPGFLPEAYQPCYGPLDATIKQFTLQSLKRDGVSDAKVEVTKLKLSEADKAGLKPNADGVYPQRWGVKITPVNETTKAYATKHPEFVNIAQAGHDGVVACQADPMVKDGDTCTGCWPSEACPPKEPWAQYLPLGMAMVNQKAVNLMNYPPAVSLVGGNSCSDYDPAQQDYLSNFTMCRWAQVLGATSTGEGFAPEYFETIVDSRPIAAAGSKMQQALPDPNEWFNSSKGGEYIGPMLDLLTAGGSAKSTYAVPVLGTPAHDAFIKIAGLEAQFVDCDTDMVAPEGKYLAKAGSESKPSACVIQVGTVKLGDATTPTPYILANHPDVSTYNCCAGDELESCNSPGYPPPDLIGNETKDFVSTCWIEAVAAKVDTDQEVDVSALLSACQATVADSAEALCIQAAIDNDDDDYRCWSYGSAKAFCAKPEINNDACVMGEGVGRYCGYPTLEEAKAQAKLPPGSDWPSWYQQNCVYEYQSWHFKDDEAATR